MEHTDIMSLYEKIGEEFIRKAIYEFYRRAFDDMMIRHFFIHSDIEEISAKQTDFAIAMLGGPARYQGLPLKDAHLGFSIRPPHFGRRQVIMKEVLVDLGLAEELRDGILLVSGELNRELGGLPIMPEINLEVALQPRMIQFSIAPAHQPSRTPAERNRRTIYTYRVRGQADPLPVRGIIDPQNTALVSDLTVRCAHLARLTGLQAPGLRPTLRVGLSRIAPQCPDDDRRLQGNR